MSLSTRPFLVIYIAWHPAFAEGEKLARGLYQHYRRNLYENVSGGAGLPVVYRSAPAVGGGAPIGIDLDEAETSAIVFLIDDNWVRDLEWVAWGSALFDATDAAGLRARVFPVAMDDSALSLGFSEQAARWNLWTDLDEEGRQCRLVLDLTYQLCRMMRSYLAALQNPGADDEALDQFLKRVEIFLSHSKHDPDGERIATLIRSRLQTGTGLGSFFDVYDIPMGLRFQEVILRRVQTSAVVAIHTDSYSSREWCRREIIEAKRHNVPLVIANCITDLDERGFPYMGNVPIVRMDPAAADRIDVIISRLLDEVLRDFLWRCWVAASDADESEIVFVPRPPELITLTTLADRSDADLVLVHPEPPLGAEEKHLFATLAPKVILKSMTEYLSGEV